MDLAEYLAAAGVMIPFIGTAAGAAMVFCLRTQLNLTVQRGLNGFAAGVMTAASVWSLLLPAIEQSEGMGPLSFVPALCGFWIGVVFLSAIQKATERLYRRAGDGTRQRSGMSQTALLVLAVTLHNIPEGMAVGVACAGLLAGSENVTAGGALALAIGIAVQNIPEGAIISMPLHAGGQSRMRSFAGGTLSGAVEPAGALLTICCMRLFVPAMPYLLSFAAGAMLFVVVKELIPETVEGDTTAFGVYSFSAGFSLMMALDVALG